MSSLRFRLVVALLLLVSGLFAEDRPARLGAAPPARGADRTSAVSERSAEAALDRNNRAAVAAWFKSDYAPFRNAPNGWTGAVNGCRVGENSAAYDDATLRLLRFYRRMAGVPHDVAWDPALSRLAMRAALIMEAKRDLSHTPPRNWPCWSEEGLKGASSSNLCLGCVGPGAIDAYVEDRGVAGVGHRRWALHPRQSKLGTGSTRGAHALYVFGEFRASSNIETVAWPPAGYAPFMFGYDARYPWSFEVYSGRADYSGARIRMTANGREVRVERESSREPLVWFARSFPAEYEGRLSDDLTVEVKIDNIKVDGAAKSYAYRVILFDPNAVADVSSDESDDGGDPADPTDAVVYDERLDTPVILAARTGNLAQVQGLLARNANPNASYQGWTPLLYAAYHGHAAVVEALLGAGADPGVSVQGWNALRLAQSRGHTAVVALLQARAPASGERSLNPAPTAEPVQPSALPPIPAPPPR